MGIILILLQCLTGLIGFNDLYYLSFLLSKDFRLALWALLSAVEVLMISVNSKRNATIIQQILNERRQ